VVGARWVRRRRFGSRCVRELIVGLDQFRQ